MLAYDPIGSGSPRRKRGLLRHPWVRAAIRGVIHLGNSQSICTHRAPFVQISLGLFHGWVPPSYCPTDGKAVPRMLFVSLARLLRPASSLGKVRGALLGHCLWFGMIRAAQARSRGETFAPKKTEPCGEPERLTLPRFERLLGWRRTSSVSIFRDGPPPG
jgi:hypothetical protein